jgi:hypothetical protein
VCHRQAVQLYGALGSLADALTEQPPLGAWIEQAACASAPEPLRDLFTQGRPRQATVAEQLELLCHGCPVRGQCAGYAARVPSFGLWAGTWYGDNAVRRRPTAA